MARSLAEKRFLVFGGSGSIGKGITAALLQHDATVHVATRSNTRARARLGDLADQYDSRLDILWADVTSRDQLSYMWAHRYATGNEEQDIPLHGIVYAVGNCPPGGFDDAVAQPLTQLNSNRLREEWEPHVSGLHNVAQYLGDLQPDSSMVVISSAIIRVTDEQCPPWLYAGHYASAVAAKDELVRWLRRDPVVKENRILIHRLAPAAVDTPFHEGCKHSPLAMLSVDEVAHHVIRALQSDTVVDEMLLPSPPRLGATKVL